MALLNEVRSELEFLKQNLIKIDRTLSKAPKGTLRLSPGRNGRNYYYIQYSDGEGGIHYDYISNKKQSLILELAQKSYYKKLRPLICNECRLLEDFLSSYDPDAKEKLYSHLGSARQELVHPMYLSIDDIVGKWQCEQFISRSDSPAELRFGTDRGEKVRCPAHAELANLFYSNRHRLLYRYEAALTLSGGGVIYPTFTLLSLSTGQKYYWEHISVVNGSQSVDDLIFKLNLYYRNGIFPGENLLLTFDTPSVKTDPNITKLLIKHFFSYRF